MLFKDIIQPKTERRKYAEETLIINYFYVNYLGKELLVSYEAEECDLKMSASTNLKRRPWLNVISICKKYLFLINMQLFILQDLNWWTEVVGLLVDYCDVFIICLDSRSDGTHSLQRIHCWASDVMLHFSKPALMKKQTNLHFGWPYRVNKYSAFLGEPLRHVY